MIRFIVQRAFWGVLVVMAVVTVVFFLIFVAGDPAVTILGPQARAEQITDFKAKKGLDRPVPEQFMSYLGVMPCIRKDSPKYLGADGARGFCGILQGDLGGPMLINAVLGGKADLVFNDACSVVAQLADFPPNSMEAIPGKYSEFPVSFAVRPEDAHLLRWTNLFFYWIRSDGRLQTINDYWINTLEWRKDH